MGVNNLWDLLLAGAVKINIGELQGKTLAIDANIWIVKMLYGVFKNSGTNQKILQILTRKIMFLLNNGIKPLFVFDGPSPHWKQKTMLSRKRRREDKHRKFKKLIEIHFINLLEEKRSSSKRTKKKNQKQIKEEQFGFDQKQDKNELDLKFEEEHGKFLTLSIEILFEQNPQLRDDFSPNQGGYLGNQQKKEFLEELINQIQQQEKRKAQLIQNQQEYSNFQMKCYIKKLKYKQRINQLKENIFKPLNEINQNKLISNLEQTNIISYTQRKYGKIITEKGNKYFIHLRKPNNKFVDFQQKKQNKYKNNLCQLMKDKKILKSEQQEQQEIIPLQKQIVFKKCQEQEVLFNPQNFVLQQTFGFGSSFSKLQQNNFQAHFQNKVNIYNHEDPQPIVDNYFVQIIQNDRKNEQRKDKKSNQNKIKEQLEQILAFKKQQSSHQKQYLNQTIKKQASEYRMQQNSIPTKEYETQQLTQMKQLNHFSEEQQQQNQFNYNQLDIDQLNQLVILQNIKNSGFKEIRMQIIQILEIFGLPYLQAPGQAQAQCAYLNQHNLVDGIVTQDCDVFLFGGKNVYRGFFAKQQEQIIYYNDELIKKQLGLSRKKLILIALMLGSDYTQGIKGIGIVNAMEVISVFNDVQELKRFRKWAQKADVLLQKQLKEFIDKEFTQRQKQFLDKHKNFKKYWQIQQDFPSEQIINAYLCPVVNQSLINFEFKKPAYQVIKLLCIKKYGWKQGKTNKQLKNLQKNIDEKMNKKITDFFPSSKSIAKINSKRIKDAIKMINQSNILDQKPTRKKIKQK